MNWHTILFFYSSSRLANIFSIDFLTFQRSIYSHFPLTMRIANYKLPTFNVPECGDMPWCETVVTWAIVMVILGVMTVLTLLSILVVNSLHHEMHRKHMEPEPIVLESESQPIGTGLSTSSNSASVSGRKPSWMGI